MKMDRTLSRHSRKLTLCVCALPIILVQSVAHGQSTSDGQQDMMAPRNANEIHEFCTNIADDAKDLRYAKRASELRALQSEVEERIAILEEKNREFEAWIARRNEFQRKAQDGLVEIYAKMRPDAAAARLEILGTDLAAVILMKLSPRQAGVILNEMDAKKAALVTGIISAAGQKRDPA